VRDAIELGFAQWGRFVFRHPKKIVALSLLVVVGLVTQFPKMDLDTSTEGFLPRDSQLRVTYDQFREQFGRDEVILLLVEPPSVFDLAFLRKLDALQKDLENEVPKLHEVNTLINARDTRGEGDELIVEDLLETWPETEADIAALRERVMSNPLYLNQLIDEDGKLTVVTIETDAYSSIGEVDELAGFEEFGADSDSTERAFLTGEENSEIVLAIQEVVARHQAPEFVIYVGGSPVMMHHLNTRLRDDMLLYTGMALVIIAACLGIVFRNVVGVVLPLSVSFLSLIASLGLLALVGIPLTLPSQILPSFLLAVGVGGAVHLLVIFDQARDRGLEREDALSYAMGHSGLAIAMTAITTAGGLLSFTAAELAPVADFGLAAPVGVMMAFTLTFSLLPALLSIFPMRSRRDVGRSELSVTRRALVRCGEFAVSHAWAMVLIWAGLIGFSILGAAQLRFSHDPLTWFQEDDFFYVATQKMNDEMRGAMFLEALIDSGKENGLHDPALLENLDELRRWSRGVQRGEIYIGKTVSIADVVKETHQALNENRAEFYAIPDQRQLVAQELLLFESSGSDDLLKVVDSQFRVARFTLKLPFVDAIHYAEFIQLLETQFRHVLGPDVEVSFTGVMAIMSGTFNAVIYTMARSYVVAFAVITPLMILLIGRLRIGLLAMVPNLAPILIALGAMGWAGLTLDLFTMLIGCIAIGLAVDDTIHFMHNFRRNFDQSGNVSEAVRETLASTGQALLFTSIVLSSGFFIFALSSMQNLQVFGLVTGFTIITAFLADILLAPALMALVASPKAIRSSPRAQITEEPS
jgi:predicted RND superfamily exporter protein